MPAGPTPDLHRYLTFTLAGEPFGLELGLLREIIGYDPPTRVPSAPAHVRGVINLRGTVMPLLDLAVRLGLPATPVGARTCILVVRVRLGGETTELGLVVDAIRDVLELGEADVEPAPTLSTRVPPALLVGMASEGGTYTMLLDLHRILEELTLPSTAAPAHALAVAQVR